MSGMVKRPPKPSAKGMLCKEHSHSAWVTNDLDKALEIFSGAMASATSPS